MPDRILPERPHLDHYKKQAKDLLRHYVADDTAALERVCRHHPRLRNATAGLLSKIQLADAQLVIAREHNYNSWPSFAKQVTTLHLLQSVGNLADPPSTFIEVACVNPHGWHSSGTLEHATMVLSRYPDAASANIYAAAVLGEEATVRPFLEIEPALAKAKGGPHGWDALTYLCFSRYLRLDRMRSAAFTATARALLEAGADANTGWWDTIDDPPRQVPEMAIYGAAGIAQHLGVTQLLLDYGADPNDEETPYHVAEGSDTVVLEALLASARFTQRSLATVTVRKIDWHDERGLRLVLQHGADPNFRTPWGTTPLLHAIRRDNALSAIEVLLEYGGDPGIQSG